MTNRNGSAAPPADAQGDEPMTCRRCESPITTGERWRVVVGATVHRDCHRRRVRPYVPAAAPTHTSPIRLQHVVELCELCDEVVEPEVAVHTRDRVGGRLAWHRRCRLGLVV